MFCKDACLVNAVGLTSYASPLFCNSWYCEICQPRRSARLKALGREGCPNSFITLTVNPENGAGVSERAQGLVAAWRTIRQRACKKYGYDSIPFMAVFEETKKGEPHLHILARCKWIDQKWLSEQMDALTGAPICDIRRVQDAKSAAWYVAKYCGKAPHRFEGVKRYWTSQDWRIEPEAAPIMDGREGGTWHRTGLNIDDLESLWRYSGMAVHRDGDRLRSTMTWH